MLTLAFLTKTFCAKSSLNDGASSTSPLIQPTIAFALAGDQTPRFRSAGLQVMWELTDFADRYYEFHTQCAARSHRARQPGGERNVQDGKSYPAALPAASSVCRGWAATKEPKCELIQLLLPDQRRELRRHRCFNVGTCELRRSSHTEFQRLRRCNGGHRGKCALPPILQLQPMFPVWKAR